MPSMRRSVITICGGDTAIAARAAWPDSAVTTA